MLRINHPMKKKNVKCVVNNMTENLAFIARCEDERELLKDEVHMLTNLLDRCRIRLHNINAEIEKLKIQNADNYSADTASE
jgi:hypothetical protein